MTDLMTIGSPTFRNGHISSIAIPENPSTQRMGQSVVVFFVFRHGRAIEELPGAEESLRHYVRVDQRRLRAGRR